jgi:hypothetical protein
LENLLEIEKKNITFAHRKKSQTENFHSVEGEKSFQKRITFSSPVGEKFPKTDNFLQDMWLKITPK